MSTEGLDTVRETDQPGPFAELGSPYSVDMYLEIEATVLGF
jgi:hypothetical protein